MSTSRILITGINGLIGTILHSALAEKYEIFGLDQTEPFSDHVTEVNIAEYGQVADALRRSRPLDAIVHLAGNPNVDASWEEVLGANIIGTRNIFEAAREFQVPRVVYASSNHVTGAYMGIKPNLLLQHQLEPEKISVRDPIRPDSDYGVSKAFGEAVARYYCARWGVEAICLRIGAVLRDDNPTRDPLNRRMWLSHRDLVQLFQKSLRSNVVFGIYYGISNNKSSFWDISNAQAELGFAPEDDASLR
jgi:nucleoside-diphosphate-sugar epimerase